MSVTSRYAETYERSLADPGAFWAEAAEEIEWLRRWRSVLDDSRAPRFLWFPGAMLNTAYNALDLHHPLEANGIERCRHLRMLLRANHHLHDAATIANL